MILIPAIDLKGGKVVRLFQGKFSNVTEYSHDPVQMATQWKNMGARWLHVVDLDGAKDGVLVNKQVVAEIVKAVGIPVQVGGGIRSEEAADFLLNTAGASRIILGTKAIENDGFFKKMLTQYGDKIGVSLDCMNGYVAQRGWQTTSTVKAVDVAQKLQAAGLQWMVYTDISRDGTLQGPNFDGIQEMLRTVQIPLIASGGISNLADVKTLAGMKGIAAAITGKAIYEGTLDFQAALKVC